MSFFDQFSVTGLLIYGGGYKRLYSYFWNQTSILHCHIKSILAL